MLEEQIKTMSKYLKKKYPNRYTLKLEQVARELLNDYTKVDKFLIS